MIEPPGQLFRRCIFEIDDRIFIAIKQLEIEKVARAMQQTSVVDFSFGMNTVFVESREGCRRGDAVKTVAMIKDTKFHKFHWLKESAIVATREFSSKGDNLTDIRT